MIAYWGSPMEKMKRVCLFLRQDQIDWVRAYGILKGLPMAEVVRDLIDDFWEDAYLMGISDNVSQTKVEV